MHCVLEGNCCYDQSAAQRFGIYVYVPNLPAALHFQYEYIVMMTMFKHANWRVCICLKPNMEVLTHGNGGIYLSVLFGMEMRGLQ